MADNITTQHPLLSQVDGNETSSNPSKSRSIFKALALFPVKTTAIIAEVVTYLFFLICDWALSLTRLREFTFERVVAVLFTALAWIVLGALAYGAISFVAWFIFPEVAVLLWDAAKAGVDSLKAIFESLASTKTSSWYLSMDQELYSFYQKAKAYFQ